MAKIIPFPQSAEKQIEMLIGKVDFNELIQLRANLVERLFQLNHEGDPKAQQVLKEVGGKTLLEQIVDLHRTYPYWEEWKAVKSSKKA